MTDYVSMTADNQQEVLLRRRRKAIAVFEKDMLATIHTNQKQEANRFLNNLRRSEMLLKEHESTKTLVFSRHSKSLSLPGEKNSPKIVESGKRNHSLSSSESSLTSTAEDLSNTPENHETKCGYSGKLKQINESVDVPYMKLSSYSKEDLRRPGTSLELKRKAWEKLSRHLDETRTLRPSSANMIAKYEGNVPKNVREARKKLCELTKVHLLSTLPHVPPRIDVRKVQQERRATEQIETEVVREFCQSLDGFKVVLPSRFCWMDVNEMYLKNAEAQRRCSKETWKNDVNGLQQRNMRRERSQDRSDIKTRRRRKRQ